MLLKTTTGYNGIHLDLRITSDERTPALAGRLTRLHRARVVHAAPGVPAPALTCARAAAAQTPVDGIPSALCPFQGRLLVGVGSTLRIYDLGKRKLLRKCEMRVRRSVGRSGALVHACVRGS